MDSNKQISGLTKLSINENLVLIFTAVGLITIGLFISPTVTGIFVAVCLIGYGLDKGINLWESYDRDPNTKTELFDDTKS